MKNWLKGLRHSRNLSQVGLAVKAKVGAGVINAVERWDYCPGPSVQSRIATALRVEIAEIWPNASEARSRSSAVPRGRSTKAK